MKIIGALFVSLLLQELGMQYSNLGVKVQIYFIFYFEK